jgi:hypothetical protein
VEAPQSFDITTERSRRDLEPLGELGPGPTEARLKESEKAKEPGRRLTQKLTGPLVEQRTKWLVDAAKQRVAYELLVELTGGLNCG